MEGARKNMRYPVEETAAKHKRIVSGETWGQMVASFC
jgi:hypothetical protein